MPSWRRISSRGTGGSIKRPRVHPTVHRHVLITSADVCGQRLVAHGIGDADDLVRDRRRLPLEHLVDVLTVRDVDAVNARP
jgi:hypothetical protein